MVTLEVSVVPVGTKGTSLSDYIARALRVLKNKEVRYEITSTGTIIEAELDEALELAKEIHKATFGEDIKRVITVIKIDERKDKFVSLKEKVMEVQEKLKLEF